MAAAVAAPDGSRSKDAVHAQQHDNQGGQETDTRKQRD
jgi:hypothetical protein